MLDEKEKAWEREGKGRVGEGVGCWAGGLDFGCSLDFGLSLKG